jgi:hypothetical protein
MTKLQILREVTGEDFKAINDSEFRSNKGDEILIIENDEISNSITEAVKKEIPYLSNEFLIKHLPEKYSDNIILNELKELCKFDHTLLSNFINNITLFISEVLKIKSIPELILDGSQLIENKNFYIFYLKNE